MSELPVIKSKRERTYKVKEMFLTVQGEGTKAGTPAVFVRLAGCNFWSGKEEHRFTRSLCAFCDTDFVGTDGENGGKYKAEELAAKARELGAKTGLVVLTGGEPLLQVDRALTTALRAKGFETSVETNGSVALPEDRLGIDWVVCSPKSAEKLKLKRADELKVIYPAEDPLEYVTLVAARHHFVQPEDGPGDKQFQSSQRAVEFCQENPGWRVSVQTHKYMGVK